MMAMKVIGFSLKIAAISVARLSLGTCDARRYPKGEGNEMKRTLIALALALAASAAQAQSTTTTSTSKCGRDFMGNSVCTSSSTTGSNAPEDTRGPRISKKEAAEIEARDVAWVAFCQPKITTGRDGIDRYSYAREGCEYGRSK
jgi:hypothetical protein